MKDFFKRIFKKKCTHKWYIDCLSNMVQLDDMGYETGDNDIIRHIKSLSAS